jgi:hypothetical protein
MKLKKTKYRRGSKMAAAGTLLQDLDSSSGGDSDLVQKILSDMNISSAPSGARPIPPPLPNNQPVSRSASGNSHITMDSNIPNSHIIGNEHPSPADFAAAITGVGLPRDTEASVSTMPGTEEPVVRSPPSKNMYGKILDETKVPLVVAFLFLLDAPGSGAFAVALRGGALVASSAFTVLPIPSPPEVLSFFRFFCLGGIAMHWQYLVITINER